MIERSGRAGKSVLLGAGIISLIGVAAIIMRGRAPGRSITLRGRRTPRSFMMEALRSVVLSVLGVLAARAAQRIPLPEPRPQAK